MAFFNKTLIELVEMMIGWIEAHFEIFFLQTLPRLSFLLPK
jgi:hypothetical protein